MTRFWALYALIVSWKVCRLSSSAWGCCSVSFIADVYTPQYVADTFFAYAQSTSTFGLIDIRKLLHITGQRNHVDLRRRFGLLRVCLGLGFFTQHVTLAIPTQKRAATCASVNPSFLRTDKLYCEIMMDKSSINYDQFIWATLYVHCMHTKSTVTGCRKTRSPDWLHPGFRP